MMVNEKYIISAIIPCYNVEKLVLCQDLVQVKMRNFFPF